MTENRKKYERPTIEMVAVDFNKSIAVSGYGVGLWEEHEEQ